MLLWLIEFSGKMDGMNKNTQALSIVGSSLKNGKRQEDEFYPTPRYAVEELLKREVFNGLVWECACGEGDISEVLLEHGHIVRSTDLVDRGYGEIENFLTSSFRCENIITNPPYKYGLEFVLKVKDQTT